MTTNPSTPQIDPEVQQMVSEEIKEEGKRRWLLLALLLLLLLSCGVIGVFIRYATTREPLPNIIVPPLLSEQVQYPPVFTFSFEGVDRPMGVAVSPDGQRIYVAEGAGQYAIKMFDRDGNLINTFAPPGTTPSNRKPTYIAVAASGLVFVSEHYNHVIDIFDADGNFIDAIIGQDLTLSEVVSTELNGTVPEGTQAFYNNIDKRVYYQVPGAEVVNVAVPQRVSWAPLGMRFDAQGNLLVTNLVAGKHSVLIYPAESLTGSWLNFDPQVKEFGVQGAGNGELSFPNSVVTNSKGQFFVSDGNNGRISAWTAEMVYQTFFAYGSAESALNLPRGLWMDSKDRLHVADAVGQFIRVYDVSGDTEGVYLFSFGEPGLNNGQFNYPTDICMDASGRLYIADRENNRIQVWSY
jgi:DNA-binding beta-propeller fold protein YncE